MSTEHSPVLIAGFLMDARTFLKPLLKEIPEEAHYEDRWDQFTGKKLEQVKVLDKEGGELYVFKDGQYSDTLLGVPDLDDLIEDLATEFECSMYFVGHIGYVESCRVAINLANTQNDWASFSDVARASKRVAALEKRLKQAGFDPGKPGVWTDIVVV